MTTHQQTLQILAQSHPDFPAFVAGLDAEINTELPPELLDDTLQVLGEDPEVARVMTVLEQDSQTRSSYMSGGDIATLLAVAFLLRTHIKIERTTYGKWTFVVEHKPGDSKMLTGLLKKLEEWLGGGTS